jgi:hypothetical protein
MSMSSPSEPFVPPTTAMEATPQFNVEVFNALARTYSKPLMVLMSLLLSIPIAARITLREAHYFIRYIPIPQFSFAPVLWLDSSLFMFGMDSRQWSPMKCALCNHDHWDAYTRVSVLLLVLCLLSLLE